MLDSDPLDTDLDICIFNQLPNGLGGLWKLPRKPHGWADCCNPFSMWWIRTTLTTWHLNTNASLCWTFQRLIPGCQIIAPSFTDCPVLCLHLTSERLGHPGAHQFISLAQSPRFTARLAISFAPRGPAKPNDFSSPNAPSTSELFSTTCFLLFTWTIWVPFPETLNKCNMLVWAQPSNLPRFP